MKKILKKYSPNQSRVKQSWLFSWFGHHILHPALWAFNRRAVVLAVSIGVFCAFVPIPAQMLLAGLLAMWLRVNVPVAIAAVWVSNPFTTVPIFYGSYLVGVGIFHIIGMPPNEILGLEKIGQLFHCLIPPFSCHLGITAHDVFPPFLVGLLVSGIILSVLTYFLLNFIWLQRSKREWLQRKLKRGLQTAKEKMPSKHQPGNKTNNTKSSNNAISRHQSND